MIVDTIEYKLYLTASLSDILEVFRRVDSLFQLDN